MYCGIYYHCNLKLMYALVRRGKGAFLTNGMVVVLSSFTCSCRAKDIVNMKEKQTIKRISLLTSALLLPCKHNITHTS